MELQLSMSSTSDEEARKAAREFAWKHFEFHAKQRIEIFKSYLTLLALIFAGYGVAFQTKNYALGVVLTLYSQGLTTLFGFWDARSRDLIKISEAYLKTDEEWLAKLVGPKVMLFTESDRIIAEPNSDSAKRSYTRIIRYFFVAGTVVNIAILIWFVFAFCKQS
jgi:hypothetical protein